MSAEAMARRCCIVPRLTPSRNCCSTAERMCWRVTLITGSTALQYLIADETIARLLAARGAEVDIFAAARLGDKSLVERCLRADASCAEARVNRAPFTAP